MTTYTYMSIPTLSSVSSELTLMLDKHIKAIHSKYLINTYKGKKCRLEANLKHKFQENGQSTVNIVYFTGYPS